MYNYFIPLAVSILLFCRIFQICVIYYYVVINKTITSHQILKHIVKCFSVMKVLIHTEYFLQRQEHNKNEKI